MTMPPVAAPADEPAAASAALGLWRQEQQQLAGEKSVDTTRLCGHALLPGNANAFLLRLQLIAAAKNSVDFQSYPLHEDDSGWRFLEALYAAAKRGVRVRMLLDDIDIIDRECRLAGLATHENFSVKLFNPFASRRFPRLSRIAGLLFNSARRGRRMHNKLLLVDDAWLIVGGRNIGNEYFATDAGKSFLDLDVLICGPAVVEAKRCFETFWQDIAAGDVQDLLPGKMTRARLKRQMRHWLQQLRQRHQLAPETAATAPPQHDGSHANADFRWPCLRWSPAHFLWDKPDKIRHRFRLHFAHSPANALESCLRQTQSSLQLVSPYFVPRRRGSRLLRLLRKRGVEVRIMTNALAATDVPMVHGAYERYRHPLLRAGVQLFEWHGTHRFLRQTLHHLHASLHAKTYIFDRQRVFIGSMNLDPRSISLNTETGILIDSADCALQMQHWLQLAEQDSYRLELQAHRLRWRSSKGELLTHEPNARWTRKLLARLTRWLPIEAQL